MYDLEMRYPEWVGLDADTAIEATPRRYKFSFGNGNDGVSHIFCDGVLRTSDPFRLAELVMLESFAPAYVDWAQENVEVDGEADYTVSATVYDPPDDPADHDHSNCADGEDCDGCEECMPESYSEVNGAWIICDVFLADPNYEEEQDFETPVPHERDWFSKELLARVQEG